MAVAKKPSQAKVKTVKSPVKNSIESCSDVQETSMSEDEIESILNGIGYSAKAEYKRVTQAIINGLIDECSSIVITKARNQGIQIDVPSNLYDFQEWHSRACKTLEAQPFGDDDHRIFKMAMSALWFTYIAQVRFNNSASAHVAWMEISQANYCYGVMMTLIDKIKAVTQAAEHGRAEAKKESTKEATKKRKEKADLLKEKIKTLAKDWIAKHPSKPATEIYGYLRSELSSFAKAHEITRGLSEREVTSKISKVKNQAK